MELQPSPEAIAHSMQLSNLIENEVKNNQGSIPFARFMDLALYLPKYGYYSGGLTKLGASGDFITAPEISKWFGATICMTLLPILHYFSNSQKKTQILEIGAGTGALAQSILLQLQQSNHLPDFYYILEISPELRDRQKNQLAIFCQSHQISTNMIWLDDFPNNFEGIILANEVLDAIPIDLIIKRVDSWYYRHVQRLNSSSVSPTLPYWEFIDGHKVAKEDLPKSLSAIENTLPVGYQTEIHPQSNAWIKRIAECLQEGIFLTFDYGFPAREYYHLQRCEGTLMAHFRHQNFPNVLSYPGVCDITSHVEWTTLNETALASGLTLHGYTSQGAYLLDAGIGDLLLSELDPQDSEVFIPQANGIQKLISEAEMGELFKAILWAKFPEKNDLMNSQEKVLPGFRGRLRSL